MSRKTGPGSRQLKWERCRPFKAARNFYVYDKRRATDEPPSAPDGPRDHFWCWACLRRWKSADVDWRACPFCHQDFVRRGAPNV